MYETFGTVVDDSSVTFRLFLPDNRRDPGQYSRGGLPRIASLRVVGDFQSSTGSTDWDLSAAPVMEPIDHSSGVVWTAEQTGLADGFYEYKYVATFENGVERWCPDPCARHGGGSHENSGFVIGGNTITVNPIRDRRPLNELVIYELMTHDFTATYRGDRTPLDAVADRLDHILELGVNAIEFMPWTAWRGTGFSWGYDPYLFFAVEDSLVSHASAPADRLVRLKRLVNHLHENDVHVIMDGVFNHVETGSRPDDGFAYRWLYQDPTDSPYVGTFADTNYFEDFDFDNQCTQQFVLDVCTWWLDTFQLDGIRFDYTRGLYDPNRPARGIGGLLSALRAHIAGRDNIALILEHLSDDRYAAVDVTNRTDATGCWYDRFMHDMADWARDDTVDGRLVRLLDAKRGFDPDKWPILYTENHDHSTIINRVGGRTRWWATQPTAIALATSPGAVLIHNGQELGDDQHLPGDGPGRVVPRPIHWDNLSDDIGSRLFNLYKKLLTIRREHPALAGPNVYPTLFDERRPDFDDQGYGPSNDRDLAIYHRWGPNADGSIERFMIVLNFSPHHQNVDIPCPVDGPWHDLLNAGDDLTAKASWLRDVEVGSHWGRILYHFSN